jgi:hypothetical protein
MTYIAIQVTLQNDNLPISAIPFDDQIIKISIKTYMDAPWMIDAVVDHRA